MRTCTCWARSGVAQATFVHPWRLGQRSTTWSARPPCHVVIHKVPRGRYHRTLRHLIRNWGNQMYKNRTTLTRTKPQHTVLFHAFTTMPREPSDARAALMAVYLSRRLSLVTPSNMPTAAKKLKSAERPSHRMKHAKELARTNKNHENIPHRWRRDVNERTHTIRGSSAGLLAGLGCTGRTIYGVSEASGGVIRRQRRRNMGKLGRPSSPPPRARTPAQVAVIKIGEGEAKMKKGDDICGHMKQTGDDRLLGDHRSVGEEHADAFFEMYINAEAWGG